MAASPDAVLAETCCKLGGRLQGPLPKTLQLIYDAIAEDPVQTLSLMSLQQSCQIRACCQARLAHDSVQHWLGEPP